MTREIWKHARIATMREGSPYGLIEDGALVTENDTIIWVGTTTALPADMREKAKRTHDCAQRCITPGLIDAHTHIIYAGNRAGEHEMRAAGASYADIARSGGGILSTLRATRAASEEELIASAQSRLRAFLNEGVTTVEIKSGYGQDLTTELRILRAARTLERRNPVTVRATYLGLHVLPPEFSNADAYTDFVIAEVLPIIAETGLADTVDAFCENIAFSPAQVERYFTAAVRLGLRIKLHADQLSRGGGASLAARFHALSADHLEHAERSDIEALAGCGAVAVLLPGAYYFLQEKTPPPIAVLREHGVPIALASDCNPGTSPTASLLLMLNMGCILFGLTPEEAIAGVTRNAARALGMGKEIGTLVSGKRADFVVWDINHPRELVSTIGPIANAQIIQNGCIVKDALP